MTEKDTIIKNLLLLLNKDNKTVSLLQNGEIVISLPEADYTIKVTRKNKRVI